ISSSDDSRLLTIFYRDPQRIQPQDVLSHNNLAEILARLGGEGPDPDDTFNFNFNDVVAIAQQMVASHNVYGTRLSGEKMACIFELQHEQLETDQWTRIPHENLAGRPQGTHVETPQPAPQPAGGGAGNDGLHAGGS